jgi:hypothetical protein
MPSLPDRFFTQVPVSHYALSNSDNRRFLAGCVIESFNEFCEAYSVLKRTIVTVLPDKQENATT